VKRKIGAGRKVLLVKDIYELQKLHAKLIGYDDLIIQEFIPGKTESLFYYLGYRNARGQNVVSFVSKKLRTLPEGLGSETVSCSTRCETVTRLGEEVLAKLNYRGPAGIDFKFDSREQSFKVIEINFRIGLTDGLLVDCGIDLPFIYYLDAQDMDTEPALDYARDVVWTWFERDVAWLRSYWRETNMSFFSWLKTYFTFRQSHASFSITDPGPFIYSLSTLLKGLFKNSF
jgi:predicted ATP-grasp superfamily ATP-dependent carboligase